MFCWPYTLVQFWVKWERTSLLFNLHTGQSLTENTITEAVLIQFDLLMMWAQSCSKRVEDYSNKRNVIVHKVGHLPRPLAISFDTVIKWTTIGVKRTSNAMRPSFMWANSNTSVDLLCPLECNDFYVLKLKTKRFLEMFGLTIRLTNLVHNAWLQAAAAK